ncbi:MAG: hypothetical protein FJ304_06295 [Planctomycetes bacterium]|nr:hypothetical protein [Planctomycetota bacterium]
MPSYVIVWENNTFGHQKVSGHTWPGHFAINIGNIFDDADMARVFNSYVSWWPGEGADFGVKGVIKAMFKKAQKGDRNLTFDEDVDAEGYLPDHFIKLDTTDEQEKKMKAEWLSVLTKKGGSTYKNLRKNCSMICSRVLHAGGFYAKKWAVDNNFACSPGDIRALACCSGGKLMKWTDVMDVLKKSGITAANLSAKEARSGVFCSTDAPCNYQKSETFKGDGTKKN